MRECKGNSAGRETGKRGDIKAKGKGKNDKKVCWEESGKVRTKGH